MKCPNCKKNIKDEVMRCPYCRHKIRPSGNISSVAKKRVETKYFFAAAIFILIIISAAAAFSDWFAVTVSTSAGTIKTAYSLWYAYTTKGIYMFAILLIYFLLCEALCAAFLAAWTFSRPSRGSRRRAPGLWPFVLAALSEMCLAAFYIIWRSAGGLEALFTEEGVEAAQNDAIVYANTASLYVFIAVLVLKAAAVAALRISYGKSADGMGGSPAPQPKINREKLIEELSAQSKKKP